MSSSLRVTFAGQSREFQPPAVLRIGRSPDCDIVLTNPRVSGHHGTLHHDGSTWVYTDAGSRNGSWLGPTRVVGPHIVHHQMTLGLGAVDDHAQLQLSVAGSVPPPPAPDVDRERRKSGLALIAVGAAVVMGLVTSVAKIDPTVSSALVTATGGIPAWIGYYRSQDRRDKKRDLAQLQRGELRRPVPLVVVLIACSLLAWDSIVGAIVLPLIAGSAHASSLQLLLLLLVEVGVFLICRHGSHYLGEHPYGWTSAAVLVMLVARILMIVVFYAATGQHSLIPGILEGAWAHVVTLGVALAGVYVGRQGQAAFVAAKATRLASEIDGPRPA